MNELVAVALPGGDEFVTTLRRVWDAGDAVLPVDLRLPPPARARLLAGLRPARLVEPSGTTTLAEPLPVLAGDALVMATSGTTGVPKGVVLTHDAVRASATATSERLAIDPERHHWLACLPLAHIGGLAVICRALHTGTRLTVHPGFDAAAAQAVGATHVSLVPTALGRIDPTRFACIVLGGAAPPAELPPNVVCTYGMTETGSGIVYDGVALTGVEVRSVDGELHVRGPMLLRAYRDGTSPEGVDPTVDGWLATGDAGSVDADGTVRVHGRAGDVIVTGAQKVWPDPVEAVLGRVPGVAEVAVIGRPDPEWGAVVTAVVVPADPIRPPALADLQSAVRDELAPYCIPRRVEFVAALPRTALGKVQRGRLREA